MARPRWIPGPERATRYLATRDIPCPHCGYIMRGLESARCPECGREADAASMIAQATRIRDEEAGSYRALRVVVIVIAAIIAAMAAGFVFFS